MPSHDVPDPPSTEPPDHSNTIPNQRGTSSGEIGQNPVEMRYKQSDVHSTPEEIAEDHRRAGANALPKGIGLIVPNVCPATDSDDETKEE
jgi:hypothetical protein